MSCCWSVSNVDEAGKGSIAIRKMRRFSISLQRVDRIDWTAQFPFGSTSNVSVRGGTLVAEFVVVVVVVVVVGVLVILPSFRPSLYSPGSTPIGRESTYDSKLSNIIMERVVQL